MAAEVSIEVYGVRDALRELGKIDKTQRFKAIAKIKGASGEMLAVARDAYPDNGLIDSAMSGWSTGGRLGYDKKKVDRGVQIQVGGRSIGNSYAVVTMIQKDAGGAMYDIAGLRGGSKGAKGKDKTGRMRQDTQSEAFLQNLNTGFGNAQRGLWRKFPQIRQLAEGKLMEALAEVASQVNRKLVA